MKRLASQSGETIVEVLVALAAVGLVLAGSAVVVSRGVQSMQTTQERSAALSIVEGQVERTREYIAQHPEELSDGSSTIRTSTFCMSNGASNTVQGGSACTQLNAQSYVLSNRIIQTGAYYTLTSEVSFDSISGDQSVIRILYRIYP